MIDFGKVKAIVIPEGEVTNITINGATAWAKPASYKNWVRYSTEANSTAIYNGGLGYKDGYRVRSGGAEAAQTFTTITGYIPYKKGDKLYIYPPFRGENTANTVNFFDSSFTNLGQVTGSGGMYGICQLSGNPFQPKNVNDVTVVDLSTVTAVGVDSIAYVRIGNYIKSGGNTGDSTIQSGAEMIITKNEEPTL